MTHTAGCAACLLTVSLQGCSTAWLLGSAAWWPWNLTRGHMCAGYQCTRVSSDHRACGRYAALRAACDCAAAERVVAGAVCGAPQCAPQSTTATDQWRLVTDLHWCTASRLPSDSHCCETEHGLQHSTCRIECNCFYLAEVLPSICLHASQYSCGLGICAKT